MYLPDDDEIYEVDQTYLGPPGRYLGTFRHKAIFAWLVIGPLWLVTMRRLNVPFTLLTLGFSLALITKASMWIADRATAERPIRSIVSTFKNELDARRAPTKTHRAAGPGHNFAPRGTLGRWARNSRGKGNDAAD